MTFKAAVINTFILTMDQIITRSDEPTENIINSTAPLRAAKCSAHCYDFPAHNATVLAQSSNKPKLETSWRT